MTRRALLAVVILFGGVHSVNADPQGFSIWVEADGSSFLWNPTDLPITFDGYQLASENGGLDPAAWTSIADQVISNTIGVIGSLGPGALAFGEATPSEDSLAEINLAGVGTLAPGGKFAIGKPFATLPPSADWFYKIPGLPAGEIPPGEIVFAPDLPEPSTWLLATLAGLGLLAMRLKSSPNGNGDRL